MTNDRGQSLIILEADLESPGHILEKNHQVRDPESSLLLLPLLFTSGRDKPGHPALVAGMTINSPLPRHWHGDNMIDSDDS